MNRRASRFVVLAVFALAFASFGSAFATDEPAVTGTESDSTQDRLLAEGRVVYEANCVGCHQTDGTGRAGVFPPLADNPNVADGAYVAEVIQLGREGEITVSGTTYNGVMPAFASLSEDQITSLTLYVQEGLGAPVPVAPSAPSAAPVPSSGLPFAAVVAFTAGFGIFALAAAALGGPVAIAKRAGNTFSTAQVWVKSLLIFLYFVVATVFIPSLVVESSLLASPPSVYGDLFSTDTWGVFRDLIGAGVWLGALLLGFWALRRAQREDII